MIRMSRPVGAALCLLLSLLGTVGSIGAQTPTGSIEGIVVDTSGAGMPGVTVGARRERTGVAREVVSDSAGLFRAPLLPVGPYTVKAEVAGFRSFEQRAIQLTIGQTAVIRIELAP